MALAAVKRKACNGGPVVWHESAQESNWVEVAKSHDRHVTGRPLNGVCTADTIVSLNTKISAGSTHTARYDRSSQVALASSFDLDSLLSYTKYLFLPIFGSFPQKKMILLPEKKSTNHSEI